MDTFAVDGAAGEAECGMDTFAVDSAAGEAESGPPLLARVYLELALVPRHRHPAPACTHSAIHYSLKW
jgi:hypothetical protein